MKLMIVSTLFGQDHGGCEELWMKWGKEARKKGHEVMAYVYEKKKTHPSLQSFIDSGAKVFYRRHMALPVSFISKVKYHFRRKVLKYNPYNFIDKHKPDIIFINQAGSIDAALDQYFREYLEKSTIPYLINPHHVSEIGAKPDIVLLPLVQKIFNGARGLIFIAKRNQEVLYKIWSLANPNIYITVNPLNLSDFSLIPYPAFDDGVKFATVAFLDCEQKGHDILMNVLASEKWNNRTWTWNIYGDGPDKQKLDRLAKDLGIGDRVSFKGFVNNVQDVWKENHIHLFPTLSEGMPMAVQESIACGRPVVATDIGGITEWVEDQYNGFIACEPTTIHIDEALERAWNKKEDWKEMGQHGHELFMKRYNFNFIEDLIAYVTEQN